MGWSRESLGSIGRYLGDRSARLIWREWRRSLARDAPDLEEMEDFGGFFILLQPSWPILQVCFYWVNWGNLKVRLCAKDFGPNEPQKMLRSWKGPASNLKKQTWEAKMLTQEYVRTAKVINTIIMSMCAGGCGMQQGVTCWYQFLNIVSGTTNFATIWRHLHRLQIWPPGGIFCIAS